MAWFTANWFWIVIVVVFIGMHMFGHGGHGGHSGDNRQGSDDERDKDDAQRRVVSTTPGGHQH